MQNEPKRNRTIRLDPKLLDKAKAKGLNITLIVEEAIARAVGEPRCPYCGSNIKNPSKST